MKKIRLILVEIILCLALLVFPFQISLGSESDSLRQLIANSGNDREKAGLLYTLGWVYYRAHQFDSALACSEQLRLVSMKDQFQEGVADAFLLASYIHKRTGNHESALISARNVLKVSGELNDSIRMTKAYFQIAELLSYKGETDSASAIFKECLAIASLRKDTAGMLAITNALGNLYQDMSEFDSAAYYYLQAINAAEASGRTMLLARFNNNLGKTFSRMEDYEKARQYLENALELNKGNDDAYTDALILMNLAGTYLEEANAEMALLYYDQAAEIYTTLGDIVDVYDLHNNYAEVYELLGKYDRAHLEIDKAIEGFSRYNCADGFCIALKNKGDLFTKQGRYDLSRIFLDSAMNVAIRAGYLKNQYDILTAMATNDEKAGDFRNAYAHESRRHDLFGEIFTLEKDRIIKSLNLKYEKEKDRAVILALRNANLAKDLDLRKRTNQRNGYLYAGLGVIILALFLFLYLRQRFTIASQKILQLEEEKKLMAAQLLVEGQEQERKRIAQELHDGLGVLLSATRMQFTSIRDISPENQPLIEKASQLLEQATGDVRKISHNMMPGLLTKMGFYEAVEDLFDNLNDKEDLVAQCHIAGEQIRLPENKEIMLYRIVQELTNNTLKHAQAKNIQLKIKVFSGMLQLNYADDGKGFDVEKALSSEADSFGLRSIQSRVSFLNGELDMQSAPGKGVQCVIQIPL